MTAAKVKRRYLSLVSLVSVFALGSVVRAELEIVDVTPVCPGGNATVSFRLRGGGGSNCTGIGDALSPVGKYKDIVIRQGYIDERGDAYVHEGAIVIGELGLNLTLRDDQWHYFGVDVTFRPALDTFPTPFGSVTFQRWTDCSSTGCTSWAYIRVFATKDLCFDRDTQSFSEIYPVKSSNRLWYVDADGDGYGDRYRAVGPSCEQPAGAVANNLDFYDDDPMSNPDQNEICGDGRDNDADGRVDEGCSAATGSSRGTVPGDCNGDGKLDISDAICLMGHLFLSNPAELPCTRDEATRTLLDFNGDALVDVSDPIACMSFMFIGSDRHVLGNECRTISFCPETCGGVRGEADLVIEDVEVYHYSGGGFRVLWTVMNRGTAPSTPCLAWPSLTPSVGKPRVVRNPIDIPALQPAEGLVLGSYRKAPRDTEYPFDAGLSVDLDDTVEESNEANNERHVTILLPRG